MCVLVIELGAVERMARVPHPCAIPPTRLLSYAVSMETTAHLCWGSVSCMAIEISVHQIWGVIYHCLLQYFLFLVLCFFWTLHCAEVGVRVPWGSVHFHFLLLHRPDSLCSPCFKFSDHCLCLLDPCSKISFELFYSPVAFLVNCVCCFHTSMVVTDHILLFVRVSHNLSC